MGQLLIKASESHPRLPAGSPVIAMPDSHVWGRDECPPEFAIVKIPEVSVEDLNKYCYPYSNDGGVTILMKRQWKLRWGDIPQNVMDKLESVDGLVVKGKDYTGPYDIEWTQFKLFLQDKVTLENETVNL